MLDSITFNDLHCTYVTNSMGNLRVIELLKVSILDIHIF